MKLLLVAASGLLLLAGRVAAKATTRAISSLRLP